MLKVYGGEKIDNFIDRRLEGHKMYEIMSLICDKSVTTETLTVLSYWYRKKRLRMHFVQV